MSESKKKRILHLLSTNAYSGAENVAITIIEHIKQEYDVVYCSPEGSIVEVLKKKDIPYLPLDAAELSIPAIRRAIHKFQPDIIHAHDFRAGMLTCLTGTRVPIVNHLHNNSPWLKYYSIWTVAYAICCLRLNRILTVSDSVMDEFVFGKYFKNKTRVIGNPVDIRKIQKLAEESTLNDKSDIIFLGRLTPQKNPFFFLQIMQKVVEKKANTKIAVVGDGELREEFEEKIEEYHLENNIKMYGFQSNPYGLVKNSKVMCLPSLWEGFGLAVVEALSLGVPVVCSGVGGLSGLVNNKCGKICGTDLNAYVEEIIKLLQDTDYQKKKSLDSISQAEKLSNIDKYIDDIMRQYQYCLEK